MPAASLWILVGGFLFTLMSLSAKLCSAYFHVYEILFWRAAFGLICIALFMLYRGIPFATKHPFAHFRRGVAGMSCFALEICALSYLPLSVEQPIAYLSPLVFCIFFVVSSKLHGNRVEWPIIGAVLIGFSGVLLIARPESSGFNLTGVIIALIAAFAGASSNWFLRDLGQQGEPNERAVFYFMLTGTAAGALSMIFIPGELHLPSSESIYPLLGVMASGLLGQVCWTIAWAKGHSLLNAVFQFSGIFFGVLLGILVLGETIDTISLLGVMVIFVAGLFASLYLRGHKKRTAAKT